MTNGRPSYPSTVFFEADLSIITRVPGYQEPDGLMPILSFLAENAYRTTSFQEYERNYQKGNAPSGK
jgi:thioredoxin-related protein